MSKTTTIQISRKTWQYINSHRQSGETMESTVLRLIKLNKQLQADKKESEKNG